MSQFTDRIRARTRLANAKRAGQPTSPRARRPRNAPELAPLGLDQDQGAAIKKALATKSIDAATLHELVREGHLTWDEVNRLSAEEVTDLAAALERYKERKPGHQAAIVAPPGNAPGEFDVGDLEGALEQTEQTIAEARAAREVPPALEQMPMDAAAREPAALPPAPDAAVMRAEFKSSNVRAAELGADGTLLVTFADGAVYAYANFTAEQFAEWEKAKSAGSWFHHNVKNKPDRHPARKA